MGNTIFSFHPDDKDFVANLEALRREEPRFTTIDVIYKEPSYRKTQLRGQKWEVRGDCINVGRYQSIEFADIEKVVATTFSPVEDYHVQLSGYAAAVANEYVAWDIASKIGRRVSKLMDEVSSIENDRGVTFYVGWKP